MRVAPEGIRTDNLTLDVPAIGSISGSGTIAPNQALDYKMSARLSNSSSAMGRVTSLASVGGNQKGSGGVPFKIQGTTSKPEFIPDVSAMATGLAKGLAGNLPASGQNLGKQLGGLFGKKKN